MMGTSEVQAVLKAWAEGYIEDVPAVHKDGKYLIEYETLKEHLRELDYESLVAIMLDAEVELFD